MARILGLDLGSYSVKAVVYETAMRSASVVAFDEVLLEPGERQAQWAQALGKLNGGLPVQVDQVVASFPGANIASHALKLPFTDAKRIDATIGFEVEALLPFDLEDAAYDYQVTATSDEGSDLLVGVVKKAQLEATLAMLHDARFDPRVVTHPSLAFHPFLAQVEDGAVAIVDIGHERTCVAVGTKETGIQGFRVFSGGGSLLTQALAKEFTISTAEATEWKNTHGAIGSQVLGADAARAASAFEKALAPILRDVRTTLRAYAAKHGRPLKAVWLCGGTSRLSGIAERWAYELGLPVSLLPPVLASEGALAPPQVPVAAQALALALRGTSSAAKAARFNLRRGAYLFKSDLDFVRDRLPQLVGFTAVLIIALIASSMVRNAALSRREKQIDAVLCDVTQRILGKCEPNYDKALNMLKGQESPSALLPKQSAVGLLSELVTRIPQSVNVTMDQVVVDLDRISMRCEAPTSKQVDEMMTALKTSKCFKDIKEGKLEKSKDGSKVQFRLEVQVDCPELAKAG